MFYEGEEILQAEIFDEQYNKKIKCFAILEAKDNSFINIYLQSHGIYYNLSFYYNQGDPFLEMQETYDINELQFIINDNINIYKIPKEYQNLQNFKIYGTTIDSNLFYISNAYSIDEVLNKNHSNLSVDNGKTFLINKDDYVDILKELYPNDSSFIQER